MSITLPDWLVPVLDIIGFTWPAADEEKLREAANAWRDFANATDDVRAAAAGVVTKVAQDNYGTDIDALGDYWREFDRDGGHLPETAQAARQVADVLETFATLVEVAKGATLVQLGIFAATIAVPGVAAVARLALRKIIKEGLEDVVKNQVAKKLRGPLIKEAFEKLLQQAKKKVDDVADDVAGRLGRRQLPHGGGPSRLRGGSPKGTGRPTPARPSSRSGATSPRGKARPQDKRTCKDDPIDVATGEMVMNQTDVELAGALPLVLARTHVSSYREGHWFGRSWSSTLDQRLEVDDLGVCYVTADGMVLVYPTLDGGSSVLPEEGPRWPLARTDEGGYTVVDPDRGHTMHFFAPDGSNVFPLTAITDRNGHRIDLDYDTDGTINEVRHSGGYRIGVASSGGLITALSLRGADPRDDLALIRYRYDENGQLTEVINSSGVPLRFGYDTYGRIVRWVDRNDVWYRYTYDEVGRCVRTSGSGECMAGTFEYAPDNRITVWTNSLGHARTFHLNKLAQVIREVDPLGNATISQWDRYDRLLARTDPLGRTTRYRYDPAGNLVAVTRSDGSQVTAEYNELRLPVTVVDPDGAVWQREYDQRGNLTALIDPVGARTAYDYDDRGNLTAITDALSQTRHVQTNASGLVVGITDPLRATTRYTRDAFGRVVTITDPVDGVTRLGWTVEGKLAWRTLPDGATERCTYDGEGNLIEYIDAIGQVTRIEIGYFDLPVAEIGPDGARLEFFYDTELRLVTVTNPQGLVWRYDYDPAGNLVRETDFNGRELRYVHDDAGQLIERTNGAGQTIRFTRDLLGNIGEQRSGESVTTFVYDAAGRIVAATNADAELAFEYDPLGRMLVETCNGRTVTSTYDLLGRRVHRRTPSGAESVWEYDANDQPVTLHTAGQALYFHYDAAGREVERLLGTGAVLTLTWDANHRLASQTLTAGGLAPDGVRSARQARLVQRRSYRYRPDGYVTDIEDHLSGNRAFDLDSAGRVTAVQGTGWSERYAYDAAGNITQADWPILSQAESPDGDARGERKYAGTLIRHAGNIRYEHDAQGRVILRQQKRLSAKPRTWRYTWDADDRLVAVTTPDGQRWRYLYDPLGRRTAKQRLGNDEESVVDQVGFTWDDVVLAEQTHTVRDGGSGRTTVWEWRPGTFRPLSQTERTPLREAPQEWINEQFYAIVTDLVGTPTEMVDPVGNLAWRPGTILWDASAVQGPKGASCPLRFPGQYHDSETGLNYNYHRYYDPAVGRYESNDPLGLEGGFNPHAYVPNPINWLDPLGLTPCEDKVKTYQTYTKTHPETGKIYSGRTSGTGTPLQNIARRDAGHHMNREGYGPAVLDKSSTNPAATRGREQQLIDAHGGAQSTGGTSGNPINGIRPGNPKRQDYLNAAKEEFE